jgi:hypothetical protein
MTWYLDTETGDVYDHTGAQVGTVGGPPYTVPDQLGEYIRTNVLPDSPQGLNRYRLTALYDLVTEDLEEGTP